MPPAGSRGESAAPHRPGAQAGLFCSCLLSAHRLSLLGCCGALEQPQAVTAAESWWNCRQGIYLLVPSRDQKERKQSPRLAVGGDQALHLLKGRQGDSQPSGCGPQSPALRPWPLWHGSCTPKPGSLNSLQQSPGLWQGLLGLTFNNILSCKHCAPGFSHRVGHWGSD